MIEWRHHNNVNWLTVSALEQTWWLFWFSLVLVLQTDHNGPLQSTGFPLWADCVLRLRSRSHIGIVMRSQRRWVSKHIHHREAEEAETWPGITAQHQQPVTWAEEGGSAAHSGHVLMERCWCVNIERVTWWRRTQTWWMIWLWVRWRLPSCHHGIISINHVSGRTGLKYIRCSDSCDEIWHACSRHDDL